MGRDHLMVLSILPRRLRDASGHLQADNVLIIGGSKYDCWTVVTDMFHQNQPADMAEEGFSAGDCWVISCDFEWPENGVVTYEVDDDEYDEDIWSRIDALSDTVSQDGTWAQDCQGESERNCGWLVGDLLNLESCQEGVDFWHPRTEPYVEWRASLYGGRFRNRTAS